MPNVIEINDIDALEDYRLSWHSLLGETRGASFFQSLDWLQCYWSYFGEGQRLRALVVVDERRPVGIVPLTVIRERTGVGPLRVLTFPLHAWGWFYGPIGANPTATLTVAMKYLAKAERDWDMCDLRWVDNDRLDHGRTQGAMDAAGLTATKRIWQPTSVVDMAGGWDAYLASRTAKHRGNQRRYEKRVAKLGVIEHIRYRPRGSVHGEDDPRWDLYDACVEVAERGWQANAKEGTTISHESVRDFFRDSYALAVRNGMADLNLLTADDKPIAFSYNYVHDGYVSGIRSGFDVSFTESGAGNVMYQRVLQDSFQRGDRVFDLGVGSLDAKRVWRTDLVNSYRYTHYPTGSPRSQILRLKHWWDRRRATSKHLAS